MHIHYEPAARTADTFIDEHIIPRVWGRDIGVWRASEGSADAKSIQTRLGWLDVVSTITPHLERLLALGTAAKDEGIRAVYLLGMGGSSLCAEVLTHVCGVADGYPELFVLDTTDEQTINNAAGRLNPEETLFLVSSKSGGTVEV